MFVGMEPYLVVPIAYDEERKAGPARAYPAFGASMKILFVNGQVWDGESDRAVRAEVLVEGRRIAAVSEQPGALPRGGATVLDASGTTLMPGLVDGHGHLPFPQNTTYFTQIEDTPVEELVLTTVHNARLMLDQGFTGVIGAGSPRVRIELAVRNEINSGRLVGPRILASTPTLTATGGLNDTAQLHQGRSPAAIVFDGPIEARRAVRMCFREGVDLVKVNISGDDLIVRPAGRVTTLAADEVAAIAEAARPLGLKLAAHARSTESIKLALRNGFDIVHHADFCDEEALDMFEERKNHVFTTPSIGFLHNLRYEAEAFGFGKAAVDAMGVPQHMEANIRTHAELRKRGVKALIGGDYGIPWQPHGTNARDIEHFTNYLGFSPVEALRCATRNGYLAMGLGHELGLIRAGFVADLLVVAGDPTQNVKVLQDAGNLRCIVKDGVFHKLGLPESAAAVAAA
jgi:imidazolonepropionase-like amidohydrolase